MILFLIFIQSSLQECLSDEGVQACQTACDEDFVTCQFQCQNDPVMVMKKLLHLKMIKNNPNTQFASHNAHAFCQNVKIFVLVDHPAQLVVLV